MGMTLSIPMFLAGLWLVLRALKRGTTTLQPEVRA
jgi:prolipoprotein diacylglyceryltransferase